MGLPHPGKRQSQIESSQENPPFEKGGRGDFETKGISFLNHYIRCNFDLALLPYAAVVFRFWGELMYYKHWFLHWRSANQ